MDIPNVNSSTYISGFFFRTTNTFKGQKVKLNIINLAKPDSLYNYGMKVLLYSTVKKKQKGVGWYRGGDDIAYYQNHYKRVRSFFNSTGECAWQ
jgi:hypothetical protein